MFLAIASTLTGCGAGITKVEAAADSRIAIEAHLGQALVAPDSSTGTLTADARVGQTVDITLTASGGTSPYRWSVADGSLPSGITLSSSGAVTGVPTAVGTWNSKIQVSDSSSANGGVLKVTPVTFQVAAQALVISTSSLPALVAGSTYSSTLQATGGTPGYVWRVKSGTLPAGLSLDKTGTVSGVPTTVGTTVFAAGVSDAASPAQQASRLIAVTVAPAPLQITSSTLSNARVGQPYSASLTATGGLSIYNWSVVAGALPAGFSLSSTGVLSGTPTTAGTANFTVAVSGGAKMKGATMAMTLVTDSSSLTATTGSLSNGQVSKAYTATLAAAGGTTPYTWTLSSGSLPAGLSLSSAGLISGTPTSAGTANFQVKATDSASNAQSAAQNLSISIAPAALKVTTASLQGGWHGMPYAATVAASGGTPAYTWRVASGSLPAGLTLSPAGTIAGMPSAPGVSNFSVMATDSSAQAQVATQSLSIAIAASPLSITTTSLSSNRAGTAYSATLAAAGGTPAYNWSVAAGSLPAGLVLSSTGVLSGTPTTSGTTVFTVQVTDSSVPMKTATQNISFAVAASGLSITTGSLSSGTSGSAYSASLAAAGGTPAYNWSLASGSLPAGLSLSPAGLISGTPTASGTANFTVLATDSAATAQSATRSLSLTVTTSPLSITTAGVASAQSGTAYATQLSATGGTPAYTWSILSGSLPAGVTLGATTGLLQGTPTAAGTYTLAYQVTDNSTPQQFASATTTIVVSAAAVQSGPTTWFIRVDGGTRYDASSNPSGQCDGKADAAYGGAGINQHCAFNDYRLLYDNHQYGNLQWVISGGDTVIVGQNPNGWRVGFDGVNPNDNWCIGDSGNISCFNPTIPSGTAAQHTRILGANYGTCSSKAAMTQIFGGHGVATPMNLAGAQYVDVQCIELTDHSNCVTHGTPALPVACNKNFGSLDDYDSDGILTDTNTHDVVLQDLWIHGHTDRGIIGAIGGLVTATNVDISTNGMAGWDFDPGNGTASVNSTLILKNSTVEWNGCNEEYPMVDAVPVESCYSQSTGGYGDGIGTPAGMGMNVTLDHDVFRYNTQDGEDFGHIDSPMQNGTYGSLSVTNSRSYGNNGQQFKWGPGFMNVAFTDNIAEANCNRLSAPFPGAPSGYNANLSDFCRAFDAMSFNFLNGATAVMAHNTLITYAQTTLDIKCEDPSSCANTSLTLTDNVLLGYSNPVYNYNGSGQPAVYCGAYCNGTTLTIGTINRLNNTYYGFRSCPGGSAVDSNGGAIVNELCLDPQFVSEPASFVTESTMDNFVPALTAASPARGSGTAIALPLTDLLGTTWNVPPSMGALEYGAGTAATSLLSTQ